MDYKAWKTMIFKVYYPDFQFFTTKIVYICNHYYTSHVKETKAAL